VTLHSCFALIIDSDVGFMMWLGELFTELGWQAIPALSCRQALTLTKRLELPIRILIVNPEMRGAERTVKVLTAANPGVRLVLIRDPASDCVGVQANPIGLQTRFTLERPSPWETISRPEWLARIRKVLI
jgi:hypothetical protein